MRTPIHSVLVAIATAGMLTGCSGVRAPKFNAVDVTIGQTTPQGLVLDFHVAARNDNPDPLPLHRATYTLYLDGDPVFQGQRSPEATIARYSTQEFVLPAVIPLDVARSTPSAEYQITGVVSYITPGTIAEVLFDAGVRIPEAPLSVWGRIDFENE